MRSILRAIVLLCLAACLATPGLAAAACPKTSVADIEDEVMCPVCGTPLALATEAPQANRERAFVLELVERCRSKAQIKAALVDQFGPRVLAMPRREGFDLAAYSVPLLALLAAGAGIAVATLRWRRAAAAEHSEKGSDGTPAADATGGAELEADMARYDL